MCPGNVPPSMLAMHGAFSSPLKSSGKPGAKPLFVTLPLPLYDCSYDCFGRFSPSAEGGRGCALAHHAHAAAAVQGPAHFGSEVVQPAACGRLSGPGCPGGPELPWPTRNILALPAAASLLSPLLGSWALPQAMCCLASCAKLLPPPPFTELPHLPSANILLSVFRLGMPTYLHVLACLYCTCMKIVWEKENTVQGRHHWKLWLLPCPPSSRLSLTVGGALLWSATSPAPAPPASPCTPRGPPTG